MKRAYSQAPRFLRVAAGLALVMGLMAADDPKKTVEAGGVTFKAPESWKSVPDQVADAQGPVAGRAGEGGRLPGRAGRLRVPRRRRFSVEANVERWRKQFKDADGAAPKVESKKVKGKNVEATRVEIAGQYHPTTFPGMPAQPDRANARLLGAIVVTDKTAIS